MQDKADALEMHHNRVRWAVRRFELTGHVMCYDSVAMYGQLTQLVRGRRVCDVGCSIGIGTAVLERTASYAMGCDILGVNVAWARQIYPWVPFRKWDIVQGPVPGKYDEVVCLEMLEHVHDGAAVVKNLLAMTGDRLWLSTPNGLNELEQQIFKDKGTHMRLYNPEDVCELVRTAGAGDVITHAFDDVAKEIALSDPRPRVVLFEVLK